MAASWKGEYENTIDGGFLWEDKIPVSHLDNLKLNLLDRLSVCRKCRRVCQVKPRIGNESALGLLKRCPRFTGIIKLGTIKKSSKRFL